MSVGNPVRRLTGDEIRAMLAAGRAQVAAQNARRAAGPNPTLVADANARQANMTAVSQGIRPQGITWFEQQVQRMPWLANPAQWSANALTPKDGTETWTTDPDTGEFRRATHQEATAPLNLSLYGAANPSASPGPAEAWQQAYSDAAQREPREGRGENS